MKKQTAHKNAHKNAPSDEEPSKQAGFACGLSDLQSADICDDCKDAFSLKVKDSLGYLCFYCLLELSHRLDKVLEEAPKRTQAQVDRTQKRTQKSRGGEE